MILGGGEEVPIFTSKWTLNWTRLAWLVSRGQNQSLVLVQFGG